MQFILEVNPAGVELIKHYESLHDGDLKHVGLQPKLCPAGVWTVGWGHALRNNKGVFLKGEKDKAEAYRQYGLLDEKGANTLLTQDLKLFGALCDKYFSRIPTSNQYSAMLCLAFNIGVGAFSTSSVLKFFNSGDFNKAADSFILWNKMTLPNGTKKILPGLTKRRNSEKQLFLGFKVTYV